MHPLSINPETWSFDLSALFDQSVIFAYGLTLAFVAFLWFRLVDKQNHIPKAGLFLHALYSVATSASMIPLLIGQACYGILDCLGFTQTFAPPTMTALEWLNLLCMLFALGHTLRFLQTTLSHKQSKALIKGSLRGKIWIRSDFDDCITDP